MARRGAVTLLLPGVAAASMSLLLMCWGALWYCRRRMVPPIDEGVPEGHLNIHPRTVDKPWWPSALKLHSRAAPWHLPKVITPVTSTWEGLSSRHPPVAAERCMHACMFVAEARSRLLVRACVHCKLYIFSLQQIAWPWPSSGVQLVGTICRRLQPLATVRWPTG